MGKSQGQFDMIEVSHCLMNLQKLLAVLCFGGRSKVLDLGAWLA
jgi:hypothetical protein